uniref:Uncharacterized protein n=1 Tax=Oryza sativa subsp. japonica TaxID=39947 RepID=Q6ZAJ9_ORYSJ|nr:hypothetical protein [Oryza sativa Japonica Group]
MGIRQICFALNSSRQIWSVRQRMRVPPWCQPRSSKFPPPQVLQVFRQPRFCCAGTTELLPVETPLGAFSVAVLATKPAGARETDNGIGGSSLLAPLLLLR